MGEKFDIDKFITEYQKMWDTLPENEDPNPYKRIPNKKKVPKPEDRRKDILKIIDDIQKKHACNSCQYKGRCRNIKWDKDLTFVRVTGCSMHPDQKEYPGKSTTLEITDTTYSGYMGQWDMTWAIVRGEPWSSYYFYPLCQGLCAKGGGLYYIYRGTGFYYTEPVPDLCTINWVKESLYCQAKWSNYSTRNATCILGHSGNIPPGVSNYDDDLDGPELGSLSNLTMTINVYNDITLSPTSYINKTGYTKLKHRHSGDVDNEAPPSDGNWGVDVEGSTGAHPPKLYVNYDLLPGFSHWNRLVNIGGG